MPNVFRRWTDRVKSKVQPKPAAGGCSEVEELPEAPQMPGMAEMLKLLPSLPSERPHILTPSPSQEKLCQRIAAAPADNTFFQQLPYEIRRRVLIEAFGSRTVHMDLRFGHPEVPRGDGVVESDARERPHCNRNRMDRYERVSWDPRYLELDILKPKEWIWSSSVCHRAFPHWTDTRYANKEDPNAAEDRCRFGGYRATSGHYCQVYGADHTQCFLGVMGWLLSCRQAYVEGIDVLYGTNTFHTASNQMVLGLDSVLVRQRIASIRAVEIVWEFHPFAEQDAATGPYEQQPRAYHELLRRLPTLLPDLRSLMLCLCLVEPKRYRIRGDDAEALQRTVMEPLDDMVRRLGTHVEECVVSLESGMYDCLRAKAIEAGEELEQFHLGAVQEQLWRPLHNGGTASRQGYWLQLGRRTYERSKLCTFCMPEPPDKYPEEFEVFYRPMLLI